MVYAEPFFGIKGGICMETVRATLQSQLGSGPCMAEDTEEMFWLRENDDAQSKIALGNALAKQYRFRDAAAAYRNALEIRPKDPTTWLRLGGAELTLFRFDDAMRAFQQYLACGGREQDIAYHMGFWHYLQGNYGAAADWFLRCLPCGDEMKIAVLYWHTLSCLRARAEPGLLTEYSPAMQVGHHTAYRLAVAAFCGEIPAEEAIRQARDTASDLDHSIAMYGLAVFQAHGDRPARAFLEEMLRRDTAWPCLSYLAAWYDRQQITMEVAE